MYFPYCAYTTSFKNRTIFLKLIAIKGIEVVFNSMGKLVHNVQKKQHRERSQPSERARYGLLEKKKDYKLRADDFHKKQAAIQALKNKAANYNPDEYYHSMTRKRADDNGVLISDRGNEALSVPQVRLLKTQDANYVRTARSNELLKIRKQKENLIFDPQGKHTVFVDSIDDQKNFRPEEFFDTDRSLLHRRENRLHLHQLQANGEHHNTNRLDETLKDKQDLKKLKEYKLLKSRMERENQLKQVEDRMGLTKELMKKGNKKKLVDSNGTVTFKWKNQRKR